MKLHLELNEADLRKLVLDHLSSVLSSYTTEKLEDMDVRIEVKSKNNYKSEWELAAFRAHFDKTFD